MIDVNSNCSRVDAVKAMASQLKMQAAQAPRSVPTDDNYRKVQTKLAAVDSEVKSGDARKAETALSTAKAAVNDLQTQPQTTGNAQSLLDVYA